MEAIRNNATIVCEGEENTIFNISQVCPLCPYFFLGFMNTNNKDTIMYDDLYDADIKEREKVIPVFFFSAIMADSIPKIKIFLSEDTIRDIGDEFYKSVLNIIGIDTLDEIHDSLADTWEENGYYINGDMDDILDVADEFIGEMFDIINAHIDEFMTAVKMFYFNLAIAMQRQMVLMSMTTPNKYLNLGDFGKTSVFVGPYITTYFSKGGYKRNGKRNDKITR